MANEGSFGERLASGTPILYLQHLGGALTALLYITILARMIGPGEMGLFAILTLVVTFNVSIGDLGLRTVPGKFIPEFLVQGDHLKVLWIFRNIIRLTTLFAIFLSALSIILAPFLPSSPPVHAFQIEQDTKL